MTLHIRWYHWLIAIRILGLLALGIAIVLEEATYRASEKQWFVNFCTVSSVSGASARHCRRIWRKLRRNHRIPVLSDFIRGAYIPDGIYREITREWDRAFWACR